MEEQLNSLRNLARLEVPGESSRLETALLIANFANNAFDHNGDSQSSLSDPVTILKEAQSGSKFRCVEYSHLAAWLMMAHGIDARTVNVMMKDVETMDYGAGHVVVEFYEGDRQGWVMVDIQAGVVARYEGVLQSALELRRTLKYANLEDLKDNTLIEPDGMFGGNYKEWLQPYLYFIDRPKLLKYEYTDDSEPHLILVPEKGTPPKYFQKIHKLNLEVSSSEAFYRLPS